MVDNPGKEDLPVPFNASSSFSCQDYYETLSYYWFPDILDETLIPPQIWSLEL